jgi:hypothetical protein
MRRRHVLQLGLGGIAALGAVPLIEAQRAMAADGPETFVYVSNAGTKDIYVLGMNRDTGELTMIEKVPVPGAEAKSHESQPLGTDPSAEGVITISKPVRERDRDHLRFVASQLVCGRIPSRRASRPSPEIFGLA